MSQRIALVGCGNAKISPDDDEWVGKTIPLKDLYSSNYFGLKRDYSEQLCDEWFILSAKYGLADPEKEVEDDYDETLKEMGDMETVVWASDVMDDLESLADDNPHVTVVVLAGQDYIEPIKPTLDRLPFDVEYPFDDLPGIGHQMGWLSDEIEARTDGGQTGLDEFGAEG